MDALKSDRRKVKRKFTEAVKTFDGLSVSVVCDDENLKWSMSKIREHFDKLVTIQDQMADIMLDENENADLKEVDAYSENLRQIFVEKSKKFDEKIQEASSSRKVKNETSDSEEESDQNALVEILGKLTTMVEQKPESKKSEPQWSTVKLEGLKVTTWNGDTREYYSWKRVFMASMKEAKQDSDQVIISRILTAVPEDWRSKIVLCEKLEDAWREFEQVITKDRVQDLVYSDFRKLKWIKEPSENEIREFVAGIRLFVRRMTDLDKKSETETDSCLSDIRFKMGEHLNLNYSNFVALKEETPKLDGLIEYLAREATIRGLSAQSRPGWSAGKPGSGGGGGSGQFGGLKRLNNFQSEDNQTYNDFQRDQRFNDFQREDNQRFNDFQRGDNQRFNEFQRGDNQRFNNFQRDSRNQTCPLGCSNFHQLAECPNYLKKTVQERGTWVRENQHCFNCLRRGHRAGYCRANVRCEKCQKIHHTSLHWTEVEKKDQSSQPQNSSMNPNATPFKRLQHLKDQSEDEGTILPIVKIEILDSRGRPQPAVALLDRGSDSSLIRNDLAERLGLSGDEVELSYGTAGGSLKRENSQIIDVQIASSDLSSGLFPVTVYSIKQPCHDVKKLSDDIFERNAHLEPVKHRVFTDGGRIDLLIGSYQATLIRDRDCIESPTEPDKKPIAVKSLLGWYITGPKGKLGRVSNFNIIRVQTFTKLEQHYEEIENMIQSDTLGIKAGTKLCVCTEKELEQSAFIRQVKENTDILPEGRLQVKIPWKDGFPEKLSNNREKTVRQLERRQRQLLRDEELEEYDREIQALLDREVVRIVPPEEITENESAWYLNHRGVKRPDKESTKIRIVFDSAAEFRGYSLNDAIEKGPNYTNSLFTCLIGWREDSVAVVGDISKMFNQIVLHEDDQKFHRFLWRDKVYQWLRVPFGDKSSPDLANYCLKLLAEQHKENYPKAHEILKERIYVDDITTSAGTVDEAEQIMSEVEKVLEHGSFPIKVWHSNDETVDKALEETVTDVLGLCWNKREDKLFLKPKEIAELEEVTKRTVLSLVAKFWDPLGLLAPCLIKYRIALQEIWESGVDWDTELSGEQVEKWKEYRREMMELFDVSLDRCIKPENAVGKPQLHGYSDGGLLAYGACIFLRWELKNGQFGCTFVTSKALVAPLKRCSIPRLELMGCVALTRLVKSVEESLRLDMDKKVLWVDATTVLAWLKSSPRVYKPFVGARIAEIQETHDVDCFRYVPSEWNPADQLTKPISMSKLSDWLQGPEYLKLSETEWPENLKVSSESLRVEVEYEKELKPRDSQKKKKYGKVHVVMATDDVEEDAERLTNALLLCETWEKVVEKIAERTRVLRKEPEVKLEGPYSVTELESAKIKIYKLMQSDGDFTEKKYEKLNPIFDENLELYKVGGRIKGQHLPEKVKKPIILPKGLELVRKLAEYYHRTCAHAGYRRVKAEIQQAGFWICGVKDLLRSIAARCMFCRTRRRPVLEQKMGELPEFRTEPHTKPFENCAIDYFGPVKVKYGGRSHTEGCICIMTCTVTRAIHLEICTAQSTEKFLLAWRRFVCGRGVAVKTVWSDNGRNFVGAETKIREMIDEWDEQKIKLELAANGTKFDWKFNVPLGSHMNGVVESLIRSVRKALDATCGLYNSLYTYEEWNTFIQEVTYLINSRPLFPEGDDPLDSPSITPNSLLHGHGIEILQPVAEERVNPRDRMKTVQRNVETFWELWMKFMPPQLLERNKWFHSRDNVQIGDLVLLTKPGFKRPYAPRATWEKAVVVATYPGEDNLVRKVRVKTKNGEYDRPIHKLCLIATKKELDNGMKDTNVNGNNP